MGRWLRQPKKEMNAWAKLSNPMLVLSVSFQKFYIFRNLFTPTFQINLIHDNLYQ